jgi:hypothetical protein
VTRQPCEQASPSVSIAIASLVLERAVRELVPPGFANAGTCHA